MPASIALPVAKAHRSFNGLPPDGLPVIWFAWCFSEPNFRWLYGPYRWEPAPTGGTATTQAVAVDLYEELSGTLPRPTIETSPPLGTASIIGIPMFVQVTNWQPQITASDDLLGTVVTVTATPTLTLTPNEPDSQPVTCNGGGIPFTPNRGTPDQQAANPHACTYTYKRRTTAPGRPPQWPTTATVTWTITWSATDTSHRTLPPIQHTVPIPRAVHEIQTILIAQP